MHTINDTIDNYNGVMLCKRPDYNKSMIRRYVGEPEQNQVQRKRMDKSSSKHQNNNEQGSFLCGTVPTPWGNTKSTKLKSEKNKVLSRISKSEGALSRHKQWLKQMQEKREMKIREKEEEENRKVQKSKEFMERQAKRRQLIRELENKNEIVDGEKEEIDEGSNNEKEIYSNLSPLTTKNRLKGGEKRRRPIWSLTENEATEAKRRDESAEEKEILDFVDGLADFEEYFDDLELKILMTQVKDRIQHLEKEKKSDESLLDVVLQSEVATIHNEKFNDGGDNMLINMGHYGSNRNEESVMKTNDDDEIQSIAATVRSRCDASISSIHSRKSMHMLVSKSRDRLETHNLQDRPLNAISEKERVGRADGGETKKMKPKTVIHIEDDGARLAEKKSLNKLPFKNRNPAV